MDNVGATSFCGNTVLHWNFAGCVSGFRTDIFPGSCLCAFGAPETPGGQGLGPFTLMRDLLRQRRSDTLCIEARACGQSSPERLRLTQLTELTGSLPLDLPRRKAPGEGHYENRPLWWGRGSVRPVTAAWPRLERLGRGNAARDPAATNLVHCLADLANVKRVVSRRRHTQPDLQRV